MFDKIIPSLELDVTDFLTEGKLPCSVCSRGRTACRKRSECSVTCVSGPQQCILCGNVAEEECTACFKDFVFSQTGFKVFCRTCSSQVRVISVWF